MSSSLGKTPERPADEPADAFTIFTEQSRVAREEHTHKAWSLGVLGSFVLAGPLGWLAYRSGQRAGRRQARREA